MVATQRAMGMSTTTVASTVSVSKVASTVCQKCQKDLRLAFIVLSDPSLSTDRSRVCVCALIQQKHPVSRISYQAAATNETYQGRHISW